MENMHTDVRVQRITELFLFVLLFFTLKLSKLICTCMCKCSPCKVMMLLTKINVPRVENYKLLAAFSNLKVLCFTHQCNRKETCSTE